MTETDEYVWVTRGGRVNGVYHTNPDCPGLKSATDPKKTTLSYPDRSECQQCNSDMDHGNQYTKPSDTVNDRRRTICTGCGSRLNSNGECEWCERYQDVMGPYA